MDLPEIDVQRIVSEARGLVGVPYHHDGRSQTGGIDCAGLFVLAMQGAGLPMPNHDGAPLADVYDSMCANFRLYCEEFDAPVAGRLRLVETIDMWVITNEMGQARVLWPGDVLVFRSRSMFNHVAMFDGAGGMIHAYSSAKRVVANPLDERWLDRLTRVYRYKGATMGAR